MGVHMTFQIELCKELSCALVTLESLHALVDFHMLIQVCSLSKSKVTSFFDALKRPFSSVYSKMVEEVVPFLKSFIASCVGAKKLFDYSFGSWIF